MSTGRRSRKAKSAASDMFKRFARGEDMLVGTTSKYSYGVGQKQGKEQQVKKKPLSTPNTPEKHVLVSSTLPTTGKGVSKGAPSNKTKSESDDTGPKKTSTLSDVSTMRIKKPSKTIVKLKVIPQVADTGSDMKLSSKMAADKCKQVRKVSRNDRQVVIIEKHKTLSEVAAKPVAHACGGDVHEDISTVEERCKAELNPTKKDTSTIKSSPTTEKLGMLLTPKKRIEDNLWSHNKNFSLSPRVKVVSPQPTSEHTTEGVYTVSMLNNVAQPEAATDIKKEMIPTSGHQTVVSTLQQKNKHNSSVENVTKCVSPNQSVSAGGANISPGNSTSDPKCIPARSEKSLGQVIKESSMKYENTQRGGTFTKIKRAKVKPRSASSKRRRSSPLSYPSDNIQQDKFFHMFGLVKKSVLAKDVSITNKLHREAGGKLRRVIKPCMKPEMVYRRLELARGCIIQGMQEKLEKLNEWKSTSKPGGLHDNTKVLMYDERRKRHEILADSKVAEMLGSQRSKPSMRPGSGRASPATDLALLKDLKDSSPIVKSARKLCFDNLVESPKQEPVQYLKPRGKKRKHLTFDSCSDNAKTRCSETPSCEVAASSADNLSKKVMENQRKDKEPVKSTDAPAPPASPVPSRRSARQQGGKRKMWCHLLRAAPDEYVIDQQWESEQQRKEEKRRARMWRHAGEESAEASHENSSNEDDSSSKHSIAGDLPVNHDATATQMPSDFAKDAPTKDNCMSSPLPKRVCVKLEPDSEVGQVDESAIKVETQTDVVKRKKKKKKKKPMSVDDDMSLPVSVIGPDGHSLPQDKCQILFEQLKPVLSDLVNNSSKIGDEVIFVPNTSKDSLECNETLPYVFSSSAGASPSGSWVGNERYRYADHECTIPHMCMVCWINDHMYCKNMKRVARDLPPCGGCIHYIPCKHYRHLKDMNNYSRKKTTKLMPPSGDSNDKSLSATSNRNDAKTSQHTPTDFHKAQLSTDDLLCYEDMLESDSEPSSPDTPAGTEILKAQLKARASQIAKSLGVKRLSSLNNATSVPEVLALPTEDKSEGDWGGEVDVCEYAAEVILFSDNGFNYTRIHEPMLSCMQPHHVPTGRTVRADGASKVAREAGSKSIISAVKDIKMPGKFCIRVAHQGAGLKPGVSAADGQKVIKVKVQRIEPKKLLLQATPSGGEVDDSKVSFELIPEEREICLPANKRGDADFDSDLLGGIIAQEAMKLVSSGNFRPQLLKLTFDGDVTLPCSKIDVKEGGTSEKGKCKKKARKKQKDDNLGLEEMQKNLNLVGEPRVSWSIETLPEDLDAVVKEEPVEARGPSPKDTRWVTQVNPKKMLTPHGQVADATVNKQMNGRERTEDGKGTDATKSDLLEKPTDSTPLVASTTSDLRNKQECNKPCGLVEAVASNVVQKNATHQKPAEVHLSKLHEDQEQKTSSLAVLECSQITPEQDVDHLQKVVQLHKVKCAQKTNAGWTENTNDLRDKSDLGITDQINLPVSRDSDTSTVTTSVNTLESDTSIMHQVVSSVDISTVTSSVCTMENDTNAVEQVVSNVDSDVSSYDSGIASLESAISSIDNSADNPDSGVTSVDGIVNTIVVGADSGTSNDSSATSGVNVSGGVTNVSVGDTCKLKDVSVTSATTINSSSGCTQDGASSGDASYDSVTVSPNPCQNHMTLDEFLQSMTLAGVSAEEIASLRQQLTSVGENEVVELVTADSHQIACDQLSMTGHFDVAQENLPTASMCDDNQTLGSTQEFCDDMVEMEVSETTVMTHSDVQSATSCSKTETDSSIVEGQTDDLGPFIICDGQIVHYNAQSGVLLAVERAALEEVPQAAVTETVTDVAFSTDCVFTSDDRCHGVDSSNLDEPDIAQITSQSLA